VTLHSRTSVTTNKQKTTQSLKSTSTFFLKTSGKKYEYSNKNSLNVEQTEYVCFQTRIIYLKTRWKPAKENVRRFIHRKKKKSTNVVIYIYIEFFFTDVYIFLLFCVHVFWNFVGKRKRK